MKRKDLSKNLTNQRRANESSLMTNYQDETILSNALNRRFTAQVIFKILLNWNFFNSAYMASSFEVGIEEFVHYIVCCLVVDIASRHN